MVDSGLKNEASGLKLTKAKKPTELCKISQAGEVHEVDVLFGPVAVSVHSFGRRGGM